jgi:hypothetical protein
MFLASGLSRHQIHVSKTDRTKSKITPPRSAEKRSKTMLSTIVTLVLMLVLILFPLLIRTTVTAIHALAQLRRHRTHAHVKRDRVGYVVEAAPASI